MDLRQFRSRFFGNRSIVLAFVAGCLVLLAAVVCCLVLRTPRKVPDTFFSYMQRADALYQEGSVQEAARILNKSAKHALSSTNWLSIIKRCFAWSLQNDAVQYAVQAVSLFPGNETLAAVCCYAHIQCHDSESALRYARPLVSGYGAVMNAYLQTVMLPAASRDPLVLSAAGRVSHVSVLNQNAAVLHAVHGSFEQAVSLMPPFSSLYHSILSDAAPKDENTAISFITADEELFWLTLLYDSGDPSSVYRLASLARLVYQSAGLLPSAQLLALQADAAFVTGNRDDAFESWSQLALLYPHYKPEIWYNLASLSQTGTERRTFIDGLLTSFPDYAPALRMVTLEAVRVFYESHNDPVEAALSGAGMKTISMIEKDRTISITRTDAERCFKNMTNFFVSAKAKISPECALEQKRFVWSFKPPECACIDIWRLLELYPDSDIINQYAVWLFLSNSNNADAVRVIENWDAHHEVEPWTTLAHAYLSAVEGDIDEAENAFRSVSAQYGSTWQLFANLAVIKEISKNWSAAVDLLTLALTHTADISIQSNLHYEIGRILAGCRNYQGARTALQYALDLNPGNYTAKVLLMSIDEQ